MNRLNIQAFLALLATVTACSPSLPRDPLESYRPQNPPALQTLPSEPAASLLQPPAGVFPPVPPSSQEPGPPALADTGREMVLQLRNATVIYPKDYRIGALSEGLGPEQRTAREVLTKFLDSLIQGKPEVALVHSQWRTLINSTLDIQKSNWPQAFRIAAVNLESEDTVRATVGLTGPLGRADGWIYLEKEDAFWRVSDWQVDLLSLPAKEKEEPFDPEGFPLIRGFP